MYRVAAFIPRQHLAIYQSHVYVAQGESVTFVQETNRVKTRNRREVPMNIVPQPTRRGHRGPDLSGAGEQRLSETLGRGSRGAALRYM